LLLERRGSCFFGCEIPFLFFENVDRVVNECDGSRLARTGNDYCFERSREEMKTNSQREYVLLQFIAVAYYESLYLSVFKITAMETSNETFF